MYYQISDYKDIIFTGFTQKLSPETISSISELCADMNVSFNPNKLHDFSARARPSRKNGGGAGAGVTADDWDTLRAFKPTPILKKEGFDKQLNDICVCLNKLSAKNAETQYTSIIEIVRAIFDKYDFECDEGQKTIKTILKICQQNKFYSEIYTQIYARIGEEYPVFLGQILQDNFADFLESFNHITYVDPNTNYDGFCDYNKENEFRKSVALFYVNLMKIGAFQKERILDCIERLLNCVFLYIDEENRVNEVEEITENINVIFMNVYTVMANTQEWDDILEKIQTLSQKKNTAHLSISNRAIFKFMDMIDL
jgi:hypothetical protein